MNPIGYLVHGRGFDILCRHKDVAEKYEKENKQYGAKITLCYRAGEDPEIERMLKTAAMYQKLYNETLEQLHSFKRAQEDIKE